MTSFLIYNNIAAICEQSCRVSCLPVAANQLQEFLEGWIYKGVQTLSLYLISSTIST